MDIFTLIIKSAFTWGIGKSLDAISECYNCGQKDVKNICNVGFNQIECTNCYSNISQFTNACDFTVDKRTGEIGQAIIIQNNSKWKWKKKSFFNSDRNLFIPYDIGVVGLLGRSLILKTEIKSYSNERIITSYSSVLDVIYNDCLFENYSHLCPESFIKKQNEDILIIDSTIFSDYKDIICKDRRIIQPY